jgi:hypothetical protein
VCPEGTESEGGVERCTTIKDIEDDSATCDLADVMAAQANYQRTGAAKYATEYRTALKACHETTTPLTEVALCLGLHADLQAVRAILTAGDSVAEAEAEAYKAYKFLAVELPDYLDAAAAGTTYTNVGTNPVSLIDRGCAGSPKSLASLVAGARSEAERVLQDLTAALEAHGLTDAVASAAKAEKVAGHIRDAMFLAEDAVRIRLALSTALAAQYPGSIPSAPETLLACANYASYGAGGLGDIRYNTALAVEKLTATPIYAEKVKMQKGGKAVDSAYLVSVGCAEDEPAGQALLDAAAAAVADFMAANRVKVEAEAPPPAEVEDGDGRGRRLTQLLLRKPVIKTVGK